MDKHFTGLSDRFCDRIYGTTKGQIRIQRVWESLQQHLPQEPAMVLDIGGGAGHIAELICDKGHQVTLVEPADNMLALAKARLARFVHQGQARLLQGSLQDLSSWSLSEYCSSHPENAERPISLPFKVVICHAVLEWLQEPKGAIPLLADSMEQDGLLSLLFYNQHSLIIKNLLRGNFYRAKRALLDHQWSGDPGSLTPTSPLDPFAVRRWVADAGLEEVALNGIRSFYDYIPKKVSSERSMSDIIELEQLLGDTEPYLFMSRYIHLLVRKRTKS